MMHRPGERLRQARERAGKTQRDIATAIGIPLPAYYDLEDFDELTDVISLAELSHLSKHLGVDPTYFFSESPLPGPAGNMPSSRLAEEINNYLHQNNVSQAAFEATAGWELGAFLTNPKVAGQWNVQCLKDVCAVLGMNWLEVLATMTSRL
jgi:transcriptional regulator with XRE-family HTH domain